MQIHEIIIMALLIGAITALYGLPIILDLWGLFRPLSTGAEPRPDPDDTHGGVYSVEAINLVIARDHTEGHHADAPQQPLG